MQLSVLPYSLAVCRFTPQEAIPAWALERHVFFSITATDDELSVVCREDVVPDDVLCEKPWLALKVVGPLDFSLIGILAALATVLAQASISIFAISTYDTDYILLKADQLERALEVLREHGHTFVEV